MEQKVEHRITYPEPNSSTTEEVLADVINPERPPIMVLFGWAGCVDKHLAKYSQIYEERGFITMRYTAPVKVVFWKRDQLFDLGELVVRHLEAEGYEDRPIFVQCMSNGGAILHVSFTNAIQRLGKPIKLSGVIFDSCPGGPNILSFYRAISTVVGGNILYNLPISTLITASLWFLWYVDIIKNYLFSSAKMAVDPFNYLRTEENVSPQFLIYSMSDALVFYNELEEFIVIRRNLGVDMTSLCFKDSPHVRHYATHREEYLKGVCEFIKKCCTVKQE